jgi:hypothetical protein
VITAVWQIKPSVQRQLSSLHEVQAVGDLVTLCPANSPGERGCCSESIAVCPAGSKVMSGGWYGGSGKGELTKIFARQAHRSCWPVD